MTRKIVDLSMHLENDVPSDPPGYEPKIEYYRHKETAGDVVKFFPGSRKKICRTAKAGRSNGSA